MHYLFLLENITGFPFCFNIFLNVFIIGFKTDIYIYITADSYCFNLLDLVIAVQNLVWYEVVKTLVLLNYLMIFFVVFIKKCTKTKIAVSSRVFKWLKAMTFVYLQKHCDNHWWESSIYNQAGSISLLRAQ